MYIQYTDFVIRDTRLSTPSSSQKAVTLDTGIVSKSYSLRSQIRVLGLVKVKLSEH
jgi:hypothetical protein